MVHAITGLGLDSSEGLTWASQIRQVPIRVAVHSYQRSGFRVYGVGRHSYNNGHISFRVWGSRSWSLGFGFRAYGHLHWLVAMMTKMSLSDYTALSISHIPLAQLLGAPKP